VTVDDAEGADVPRALVQTEDGPDRRLFEHARLDHAQRPPGRHLLGGLKDEHHRRGEGRALVLRLERRGRPEEHRRVGVVAAGVHHPRPLAAVG
jgi:hypothetical protein